MTGSAYAKGRNFEYDTRDHLKLHGYFVMRSAGSKTFIDLVAIKKGEVLLIQCKLPHADVKRESWNLLVETAAQAGAVPLVARKVEGRKAPQFMRMTRQLAHGERQAHGMLPFHLDVVARS